MADDPATTPVIEDPAADPAAEPAAEPVPAVAKEEDAVLSDDDIATLIKQQEADAADADAQTQEPEDANPNANLTPEQMKWQRLAETGVDPETLLRYASAGFDAEQAAKAAKGEPPGEPKAKPATPGKPKEGDFISKKELAEVLRRMETRTAQAVVGAQNEARLNMFMERDEVSETDDAFAYETIRGNVVKALNKGVPLDVAYKASLGKWNKYIAGKVAAGIQKRIEHRSVAGETGGQGSTVPDLTTPEMKHGGDDFRDGTAHRDAMAFMKANAG